MDISEKGKPGNAEAIKTELLERLISNDTGSGKMRISKGIIRILVFLCMAITLLFCRPMRALAKEANVSFGSESYSKGSNEEFPIGVYIRGESQIGVYYVEVQYDTDRLEYIDGGDSEQDGVIILQGTGLRDQVKYMLHFRSLSGGQAGIRIRYAEIVEAVADGGEAFTVTSLGTAPITVAGRDETGISFFEKVAEEDAANEGSGGQALEGESAEPGGGSETLEGEAEEPENGGENEGPGNGGEASEVENDGPEGWAIDNENRNEASLVNQKNWGIDSDLPILAAVDTGDGQPRYVVDHDKCIPEAVFWDYRTLKGQLDGQQVTFLTNAEGTIRILYLMEEIVMDGIPLGERFQPYAYSIETEMLYLCQTAVQKEEFYLYMSPYACSAWPEELTLQAITNEHVFCAIDREGRADFYQLDRDENLTEWNSEVSKASTSAQVQNLVLILAAAFIIMGTVCICTFRAVKGREKGKSRQYRTAKAAKSNQNISKQNSNGTTEGFLQQDEVWDLELYDDNEEEDEDDYDYEIEGNEVIESYGPNAEDDIEDYDLTEEGLPSSYLQKSVFAQCCGEEDAEAGAEDYSSSGRKAAGAVILEPVLDETESPVISVQDVTMVFHISTSSASGIKEYLIQWMKRQVTFRELTALDHVSFDVFKGEVVGIIGTNGSGKSTLLRIVSGALSPSGGRVVVDRRKVQLLTLGTGFDMELSAKENVYLNGAIIGYSKEFLDAHYEEIVRFAELEGFMEEKVKNFSSGMVSRLGFAVATAGDAAEILILDEVLSVGDEFFRKKSLKRIKEMIHGGSTVLMVSHSLGTILENCSKVVWIEKGKLKMVGTAKEVCGAYERMNA